MSLSNTAIKLNRSKGKAVAQLKGGDGTAQLKKAAAGAAGALGNAKEALGNSATEAATKLQGAAAEAQSALAGATDNVKAAVEEGKKAVSDAVKGLEGPLKDIANNLWENKEKTLGDLAKCGKELGGKKGEKLNLAAKKEEITNIIEGLQSRVESSGVIKKSELRKELKELIKKLSEHTKEIKGCLRCLISKFGKSFGFSLGERLSARVNLWAGDTSIAKVGFRETLLHDLDKEINVEQFEELSKKIEPFKENFEKLFKPGQNLINKLQQDEEQIKNFGEADVAEILGNYKDLSEAVFGMEGGESGNSILTFDKNGSSGKSNSGSDDSKEGSDLSKGETGSNPISEFADSAKKMHEQGALKDYLNGILESIGLYFGVFFLIITMPAMPVVFYLSILYNVILLTWEKFKALDTYK